MVYGMLLMAWRDTARSARFFMIDYRGAFPILIFLLHIRVWTFLVLMVSLISFYALERWGFTVPVFIRRLRSFVAGPRKYAKPWWRR